LFDGYRWARDKGVRRFGIHTMVASNERDPAYFVETADILFHLVDEITRKVGIRFEFINLGGGIGIPRAFLRWLIAKSTAILRVGTILRVRQAFRWLRGGGRRA
jgi:diaminopimelate decarboxylase